jgi:hypothetical protein
MRRHQIVVSGLRRPVSGLDMFGSSGVRYDVDLDISRNDLPQILKMHESDRIAAEKCNHSFPHRQQSFFNRLNYFQRTTLSNLAAARARGGSTEEKSRLK